VKKQSDDVRSSFMPFDPIELGRVAAGEKDVSDKFQPGIRLEPIDLELVVAGEKDGVIKSLRHLAEGKIVCILFSDGVWWEVV
jgi:hypothetical protein